MYQCVKQAKEENQGKSVLEWRHLHNLNDFPSIFSPKLPEDIGAIYNNNEVGRRRITKGKVFFNCVPK